METTSFHGLHYVYIAITHHWLSQVHAPACTRHHELFVKYNDVHDVRTLVNNSTHQCSILNPPTEAELLNQPVPHQTSCYTRNPWHTKSRKLDLEAQWNSKHSVDLCLHKSTKDCGYAKTWSLPANNSDIRQWRKADKCCVCYTSVCVSWQNKKLSSL